MRTISLSLLAIVTVFGIPRLANEYRASPPDAKAAPAIAVNPGTASRKIESQPAIGAAPLQRRTNAVPVEKPVAVQLVPVSLRPAEIPVVPASQAPALPANGRELISAIQKELSRLGCYDGPDSGRWNKAVRHGVRQFIRRAGGYDRNPRPSLELLASLQAADPAKVEAKLEKGPAPDLQPVRQAGFNSKETLKASAAASEPSDDYLPPWMTRKASAAKPEASYAANATPPAAPGITRQVHHKRHRRDRGWRGGDLWGF